MALFADYLPRGSYLYSYTMRATLPGEFQVIPTTASELYFPEVYGRGMGSCCGSRRNVGQRWTREHSSPPWGEGCNLDERVEVATIEFCPCLSCPQKPGDTRGVNQSWSICDIETTIATITILTGVLVPYHTRPCRPTFVERCDSTQTFHGPNGSYW